MAEKTQRHADNVPGSWYVDQTCIICGLCSEYAPSVFRISEEGDHNYVYHQPATSEEVAEAERARESCPIDAIGNDG